jgi:hypothetical protein
LYIACYALGVGVGALLVTGLRSFVVDAPRRPALRTRAHPRLRSARS